LTFGCFHWETKRLIFNQSKTRQTVTLPIPYEVGWAVIDYLKYGRSKLFINKQLNKLTKEGITYIISQYVGSARRISASMPEKVMPHMFRHSKAMHLLQAGVSLIYIRDLLGHEDIKTTEIYAKCDCELKRQAIENAYPDLVDSNLPDWNKDAALLDWLSSLK
jgi:site-specific recombinase XerD